MTGSSTSTGDESLSASSDPFIDAMGYRRIVEAIPDRMVAVDRDLRIRFVKGLAEDTGPPGASLGRSVLDFVPAEHHDTVRDQVARVFTTGASGRYETEAVDRQGKSAWYLSNVVPLTDDVGEVRLALIVARDISERRDAEIATERALERERDAAATLRDLDELKAEFVAKFVHDLRTPITVIQGFATTLEDHWATLDDAERRRFLEYMSDGADRLMRLVEDMMLVARIDSDEMPIDLQEFDLVSMLERVVEERQASIRRFDAIELDAPDTAPTRGDPVRLRQVVVNLLDNALRYAPEGTPVRIVVAGDHDLRTVSVEDGGKGIAPADQKRLFDRFTRVEPAVGDEGSGLGLYICRSIVEAHGGTIELDSAPGAGARFTFTIPGIGRD